MRINFNLLLHTFFLFGSCMQPSEQFQSRDSPGSHFGNESRPTLTPEYIELLRIYHLVEDERAQFIDPNLPAFTQYFFNRYRAAHPNSEFSTRTPDNLLSLARSLHGYYPDLFQSRQSSLDDAARTAAARTRESFLANFSSRTRSSSRTVGNNTSNTGQS